MTPEEGDTETPPRLRRDIRIGPPLLRNGAPIHVIKDPVSGHRMTVGKREHFIMSRLDGRRALGEIGEEYHAEFGRRLDEGEWSVILRTLAGRRLLEGIDPPAPVVGQDRPRSLGYAQFPLFHPEAALEWMAQRASVFFSGWFLVPAATAIVATCLVVAVEAAELARAGAAVWQRPWGGVLVVAVLWAIVALHELGHGLAAKRFGAGVRSIGIQWRFPLIAPYCAVEDIQLLRRRYRVAIAAAGVFVSLAAMPPVLAVRWLLPAGNSAHIAASALLLYGTVAALINFVPFLRLDGYAMLNHALGTEDLARDSLARIRGAVTRGGAAVPERWGWMNAVYLGYGGCTVVFYTLLAVALLLWWYSLLSHLIGGAGAVAVLGAAAVGISVCYRMAFLRRRSRPAPRSPS